MSSFLSPGSSYYEEGEQRSSPGPPTATPVQQSRRHGSRVGRHGIYRTLTTPLHTPPSSMNIDSSRGRDAAQAAAVENQRRPRRVHQQQASEDPLSLSQSILSSAYVVDQQGVPPVPRKRMEVIRGGPNGSNVVKVNFDAKLAQSKHRDGEDLLPYEAELVHFIKLNIPALLKPMPALSLEEQLLMDALDAFTRADAKFSTLEAIIRTMVYSARKSTLHTLREVYYVHPKSLALYSNGFGK